MVETMAKRSATVTVKLTPDERQRFEDIAWTRRLRLSQLVREGMQMVINDQREDAADVA